MEKLFEQGVIQEAHLFDEMRAHLCSLQNLDRFKQHDGQIQGGVQKAWSRS